ncbi:FtsK/SpoIIIE domain-containing protein [Arthrobacter sp. AFG7.2]|uniref:FtsK/SpoIIIE domain-containing protein n=1 Tax=Arthrobacter sp. AFG7.2 TaxID=1688693 RepID=UPI001CB94946|nr:FtsK/SpoIIIE domain-containing protein [Arthrobacter sp. AFG7.2]
MAGKALELSVTAPPGTSGASIHAELVRRFGTGAVSVGGEDLCSLNIGTAPLVTGALLVDLGSQPVTRKARRRPPPDPPAPIALAVHTGAGAGTLVPLQRGTYTVGRSNTRIVLPDPELSREHARLVVTEKDILIIDLGSANGTYVDGERVRHAIITTASSFRCGSSTMSLVFLDAPDKSLADAGTSVQDPITVSGQPESGNRGVLLLTAALPLVIGVGLALFTGMWMFLAFALVSAVSVLIPLISGLRHRRQYNEKIKAATAQDHKRRQRAGPSLALLVLAARQGQPAAAAPGEGGVWLRLGQAPQAANLKVGSGNISSGIPSAGEVPVMLDPGNAHTIFRGPCTVTQAMVQALIMQLSGYPCGSRTRIVVSGHPKRIPLAARFLPSVILAGSRESCLRALTDGFTGDHERGVLLLMTSWGEDDAGPSETARQLGWQVLEFHPADSPRGVYDVELIERQSRLREPGRELGFVPDLAPDDVFNNFCRSLAASPTRLDRTGDSVPCVCRLEEVLPLSLVDTASRWTSSGINAGLAFPLGLGATGPMILDLQTDGPHLLVAGTTGSGKSELLRSLALALTLSHPPDRVNFLFIDFKGGAGLGPLAGLVHCVGVLTDLSAHELERTLASLRAEIRLREEVLAAAQVPDLAGYMPTPASRKLPLPHLVIVIDEFRMLVDDAPDVLRELMRIASIGRSLGLHLVMATQRPQGALTADIRANVTSSIALRVQSEMESHDIINTKAAAGIGLNTPGRAFIARGMETPQEFQAASTVRAVPDAGPEVVKVQLTSDYLVARDILPATPEAAPDPTPAQAAAPLVAMVRDLWTSQGGAAPRLPVAPPLPQKITCAEADGARKPAVESGGLTVALGLLDVPDQQLIKPLVWSPARDSHLALIGGPGSGAAEALELAAHGVAYGTDSHCYFLDSAGAFLGLAAHPRTGAHAGPHELRRAVRILERLNQEMAARLSNPNHGGVPLVLVMSGWGSWLSAFRSGLLAWAEDLVQDLVRDGSRAGITIALSGDRELVTARFCGSLPNRIYFPTGSNEDSRIAWPRMPSTAHVKGRGVAFGSIASGSAVVCQLYEHTIGSPPPWGTGSTRRIRPGKRPFRVEPLPSSLPVCEVKATMERAREITSETEPGPPPAGDSEALTKEARVAATEKTTAPTVERIPAMHKEDRGPVSTEVFLGVGGDELHPVSFRIPQGGVFAVLGGASSGKTNVLQALQALNPGTDRWLWPGSSTDPGEFWKSALLRAKAGEVPGAAALLVDDIDLLPAGALLDLSELHGLGHAVVLTASYSPLLLQRVPLVMDSRAAGSGLLLSPRTTAEGDLFGVRFDIEPNPPAGRGVLVSRGNSTPVQVAWAGTQ